MLIFEKNERITIHEVKQSKYYLNFHKNKNQNDILNYMSKRLDNDKTLKKQNKTQNKQMWVDLP